MPDEVVKPSATVRIEKTIKNAPVNEEDIEMMEGESEATRKPGRPSKKSQLPVVNDETDGDEFQQLLQDHTVRVHVDRVSPREWKGKQISGMIEEYVPPTTQEEIETDIRNRFGGGRYRIRILKNGRFLGARGVSVYGDPKLASEEEDAFDPSQEFEGIPFRDGIPAGPPVMDDEITILKKEIEKERLKKVLKEVKDEPNQGAPVANVDTIRREAEDRARKEMKFENDLRDVRTEVDKKLDSFIASLKDTLRSQKETDPGRQSDIVALDNKVERLKTEIMADVKSSMSELKALLMQPKQEKPDHTPQMMQAIIQGFSNMNTSSEAKLSAIAEAEKAKTAAMMASMQAINDANAKVAQAQTDKLVTILQSRSSEGGIDGIAKTVSAVRDIAESMGLSSANAAEPEEPQDIQTRLLGMVEKALPTLLAAYKNKAEKTGQQLSKEEIEQIIAQQARRAAQAVVAQRPPAVPTIQRPPTPPQIGVPQGGTAPQIPPQINPGNLPPPMSPIQVSQQAHAQQTGQGNPVQAAPPAPPLAAQGSTVDEEPAAPANGTEDAHVQPPVPAVPQVLTPEQIAHHDKADIVNDCMEKLLREVRIRPRVQSWNEYATDNLPDDVLEKLVLATDIEGVLNAIRPYVKPEYIEDIQNVFKAEPRSVDWFVKGLNEMKTWYAEGDQETEADGDQEEEEEEVKSAE